VGKLDRGGSHRLRRGERATAGKKAAGAKFSDFYNDNANISPTERAKIDFGAILIGRLVEAREAEDLTRARLAEAAGLAQSATASLETMKAAPRTDTLFKVLTPMGCKLAIAPDETGRRFHFGRPGGPEIMKKKCSITAYRPSGKMTSRLFAMFPDNSGYQPPSSSFH
jgi:transcriptional regulator with XRE-family HTH domain